MALALNDRLSTFDKQQLLNLKANALRLQADAGAHADKAAALLPLIEAELSRRSGGETAKVRAKRPIIKPAATVPEQD